MNFWVFEQVGQHKSDDCSRCCSRSHQSLIDLFCYVMLNVRWRGHLALSEYARDDKTHACIMICHVCTSHGRFRRAYILTRSSFLHFVRLLVSSQYLPSSPFHRLLAVVSSQKMNLPTLHGTFCHSRVIANLFPTYIRLTPLQVPLSSFHPWVQYICRISSRWSSRALPLSRSEFAASEDCLGS